MIPLLLFLAAETCVAVRGDRIRAGDLARAGAALARVEPDREIAWAPLPGLVRRMSAAQVAALARTHGGDPAAASAACFIVETQPVEAAAIEAALRKALGPLDADAGIEILELPRGIPPKGDLGFELRGLGRADKEGRRVWRGRLVYAAHRSVPFWVRVRITATGPIVIAARDLPRGAAIGPGDIRVETRALDLAAAQRGIQRSEAAVGRAPRRAIAAGTPLTADLLGFPVAVKADQPVTLQVRSGSAQLAVEAKAETAGAVGDRVWIRSALGGRRLRARVVSPGLVEAGGTR